jgi:hypothetical protein
MLTAGEFVLSVDAVVHLAHRPWQQLNATCRFNVRGYYQSGGFVNTSTSAARRPSPAAVVAPDLSKYDGEPLAASGRARTSRATGQAINCENVKRFHVVN